MIFEKSKYCRNFYIYMVFFFLVGFICMSVFFNLGGADLHESGIILYFGIYFLIGGLGQIIILVYYYSTRFEKTQRKFSIEGVGNTWISIILIILGIFFICFTPSQEMIILGSFIIFRVSIVGIVFIAYWLHDRKTHKKENLEYLRKAIKNLSTDKPIQEIKKKNEI